VKYKLTDTQISDGWVLFTDRFPTFRETQRARWVNVMYADGSVSTEAVNPKTKEVGGSDSLETLIAWQTPKPLKFAHEDAYSAIPYGIDGLHAVRRNSDGFIRAWDIPGEHTAQKIAEEYNKAVKKREPHERQI
jgi:prepilin-type processing-associated H-X9-DG protein